MGAMRTSPPLTVFHGRARWEAVRGGSQPEGSIPSSHPQSHGVMVIIMGFGPIDSGSTPDGTIAYF